MKPSSTSGLVPIPGPSALPIVGNIFDIDDDVPMQSVVKLAEEYRPIFKLELGGEEQIFVTSVALLNEICDEKRFRKVITGGLLKLRSGVNDGLFTAHDGEHSWDIAHRILLPVFGPTKIRDMFPQMKEVADQLCLKWARFGPSHPVDPASDFTRLTLDTIGLCGMGFRFNSFYRDGGFHPFVDSMNSWLKDADKQSSRPEFVNNLRILAMKKFEADIKTMRTICQDIVDQRRKQPVEAPDLLNSLLYNKDPNSGEGLNDESIIDNMITFLVAGHETTSGLLSFAFYYLLKNPEAFAKARQEVDEVVGAGPIDVAHLPQLKYISALMRETLRLMPTAPGYTVGAREDTVIGGKYRVKKDAPIAGLLPSVHTDPEVYGADAREWKPERMLDDGFNKLPPGSWKPFGSGKRGCIGRAFAWQEAQLVIALTLQVFDLELDDPTYDLKIKESLTLKPDGFFMRASLRRHKSANELVSGLSTAIDSKDKKAPAPTGEYASKDGKPISILYGTNSGTCESLAHRLASDAAQRGYTACSVESLDSARGNIPTGHPVVIFTSSYDGNPPENAAQFADWLESAEPKDLSGVSYAVFGCGHHDWTTTFHKIPILVDEALERHGAKRIVSRGSVDTAEEDAFLKLEEWEDQFLWPGLGAVPEASDSGRLKITYQPPYNTRKGFVEALVSDIRLLSKPGVAKKGHIELMLPQGMTYSAGDSLAVLPLNSRRNVQRVLSRFHLAWDSMIRIENSEQGNLPSEPISVADLFSSYVELAQPATPRNIRTLIDAIPDDETKKSLLSLASTAYATEIRDKRVSVLELLERFPNLAVPVETFLSTLPVLRHRLYSISSSPTWQPSHASLTFSVVDAPARSGAADARFLGVASNHFLDLTPGAVVRISLRTTNPRFRPPPDPLATPVVLLAAGAGLAPFRAFVQDRAERLRGGSALAPALLLFGCRGPRLDDLYREELDAFEAEGVVSVRRAYSREPGHADAAGCAYVQERLWREREEVLELWEKGAVVYVCGGTGMAEAVKEAVARIVGEGRDGPGELVADPAAWVASLEPKRYIAEVFA
ncbi:hypothetical protein GTA08_BOTSDO08492 [Neofusicoccum parvum]|nr:hypothetical protein GTA08_BOTSDO08492 [Neofusicoccum parvum]